jgi:1-acyl-sn-glycerol-3-phosphate acyltransferase
MSAGRPKPRPRAAADGEGGPNATGARAAAGANPTAPPPPTDASEHRSGPPAPPTDDDLRALLPAVEPERRVDDWGRSERIEGLFDRTVFEFLYRLWFRCEVEGVEHVPAHGGALVVSNHAGALPPDAAMIAKAIKEEHPRARPLHMTAEHFFKGYPGFSLLLPKIGCVPAHPANVHRLLADEQQLVLVFPEGRKGTEKLYKDRYRLRRFGRGGFVEAAMRARAPIVPVAVVGAEEAAPIFAHVPALERLTGLIYFPITPTFPHFGPLGMLGYLPAKFRIRFLPAVPTDDMGAEPWHDKALVQTVADEVRDTIQEHVLDMVARRQSIWF